MVHAEAEEAIAVVTEAVGAAVIGAEIVLAATAIATGETNP
jgi:hypothetical protein